MSKVSVKVEFPQRNYETVISQYQEQVKRIIVFGINDVANFAKDNIARGVKTGTERPDGSRRSADGEFPATDTGFLISNINAILESNTSGRVESNADYSSSLEFGTSKMGARPFLQPSLEQARPKIRKKLNDLMART